MEDQVITTDWNKVYQDSYESGGWSYLSRTIVRTIQNETKPIAGRSFIELGCGSGRNSFRLARKGAKVTLLDLSKEVLDATQTYYQQHDTEADFIQGNIFDIPVKDDTYQVVWNAGVIEHWVGDEQVACLKEMIRICHPDGMVLTLNPNKASILHVLGKRILGWFDKYAYPDEVNIGTLAAQSQKAGGFLAKKEYSIGFFVLFVGLFIQLKSTSLLGRAAFGVFKILNGIFTALDRSRAGNALYSIDRALSSIFGGYLLVSVIKKKDSDG